MFENSPSRGRAASEPREIPAAGWWDVLIRVWHSLWRDNVTLVSGGLAMYALLSVFPALGAAVAGYGLLFRPADVIAQMRTFSGVLPPGVWELFNSDLQEITRRASGTLTLTAFLGLGLALLSARSGMSSLMQATNIAYQEHEKRSLLRQILISLLFTLAAIVAFLLMLLLGVAVPLAFAAFGTAPWVQVIVAALRWLLLWAFAAGGLMLVYRFAPARRPARWSWVAGGALVAATLWLGGSVLFALYVRAAGTYTRTYGALGSVIALLTWFYLSSFVLVLGAEINAEMERQTRRDTTEGPEKPLGARGAYAADTVGPSAQEIRRVNGTLVPDRRKQGDSPLRRGAAGAGGWLQRG